MKEKIKWKENTLPKDEEEEILEPFNKESINKVRDFHKSFPQYKETPLVNLNNLSKYLGVDGIYVKD